MLKKHKEKFRSGLLQDADEFKRAVTEIVESFEAEGPFTSDVTQEQVRLLPLLHCATYVHVCPLLIHLGRCSLCVTLSVGWTLHVQYVWMDVHDLGISYILSRCATAEIQC